MKPIKQTLNVSHVYCLSVKEYTYVCPIDNKLGTGPACLSLTKEEYEILKSNGIRTEEYTEVVFSKQTEEGGEEVRQLMFKYVAYVDKASHTNF